MESLPPFSSEVIDRLSAQVELFNELNPDEREILLNYMDAFLRFKPEEVILMEEQADDRAMYQLLSGRANVICGESHQVLDEIRSGDFFGEISFLTEHKRTASVVAHEACLVWRIDHELLDNIPATLREKIKDKIIEKLIRIIVHSNKQMTSSIL